MKKREEKMIIPTVSYCCCCIDLRSGGLILGWIGIIHACFFIIAGLITLDFAAAGYGKLNFNIYALHSINFSSNTIK